MIVGQFKKSVGMIKQGLVSIEVYQDYEGFQHLRCKCSEYQRKYWCEHIQYLYVTEPELDASLLSSTVGVQIYKHPRSLIVPVLVLPVKTSGAGKARVRRVGGWHVADEDDGGTVGPDGRIMQTRPIDMRLAQVKVVWGRASSFVSTPPGTLDVKGECTLGYIIKGQQGRHTLRRLVFEWLVGIEVLYGDMVCGKSFHSHGDSFFDTFSPGPPFPGGSTPGSMTKKQLDAWRIRDAFTLLDSGMCYKCLEASNVDLDAASPL